MKIRKFITVWISLVAAFTCAGQDTTLVDVDTLDIDLMDSLGYRNYEEPDQLYMSSYGGNVKSPEDKTVNKDDFYPMGWSKDGYFAYAIEPHAENCDCYYVEFYIKDLKTDSIVYFYQYDNEWYEAKWRNADETEKDSLRQEFICYYMRCVWHRIYNELSEQLFRYGIVPEVRTSYQIDIEDDEKFSRVYIDTLEEGFKVNLDLFFEFDVDTIRFEYVTKDSIHGVNYHGYIYDNNVSEWNALILSERHYGLDTSKSETWHYKIMGFKRDHALPFDTSMVEVPDPGYYIHSDTIEKAFRKVSLIEQMSDRVTVTDKREWFFEYGNQLGVHYENSEYRTASSYYYAYGNKSAGSFRKVINHNDRKYHLDKTIFKGDKSYYLYGQKDKNDNIKNVTQLICYNSDSGDVEFWYDLTALQEGGVGGIRWIEVEDSLIYVSFGSDTVSADHRTYGKILAVDTKYHCVVWQSDSDIANAESFEVVNDVIIAGFMGKEDDYLTLLNKKTGTLIKKITLLSDPLWIVEIGENLYLRTEISNHDFRIESTFFKSY